MTDIAIDQTVQEPCPWCGIEFMGPNYGGVFECPYCHNWIRVRLVVVSKVEKAVPPGAPSSHPPAAAPASRP